MTYRTTLLKRATIVLASALSLAGCGTNNSATPLGSDFFPPEEDTSTHRVFAAQAANGARNDGMLYGYHFDNAALNSLGESKLNLMANTAPNAVTTVYLNVAEDDMLNPRRESVAAYLKGKGVDEARTKFVSGPNPATITPTAGGIARFERTENINSSLNGGGDTGNAATGNFPSDGGSK
jgi:hypothetical protein